MKAEAPLPDPPTASGGEARRSAGGPLPWGGSRTLAAGAELARALAADASALAQRIVQQTKFALVALPSIKIPKANFSWLRHSLLAIASRPFGSSKLPRWAKWLGGIAASFIFLVIGLAVTLVW